ncbi:MAG: class I SAM-dependent methyltransferase [Gammaproteobacteria bacterium]|nr:class I SAM-dependent methyltransferase [Gammaproteobacteria bacterium]MBU1415250.1 class I SAM-dependent methyltransferase [Gammaproteobacteria bacterium]
MKDIYGDDFYKKRLSKTNEAANLILDHVLKIIPEPHSAVDLGCGIGAWLAALRNKGVDRLVGIDGPWVNQSYLAIDASEFRQMDFSRPLSIDGRFDLAISLEVAEHLPKDAADQFVRNLVGLADFILFSAAPPLQGGTHHINEQPIGYWLDKFKSHGFIGIDCVRPYFWNERRIGAWYRQNTILLAKESRVPELKLPTSSPEPASYLHPEIYLVKLQEAYTAKGAWKLLRRAIKRKVKAAWTR